jgi:hypothetical protein
MIPQLIQIDQDPIIGANKRQYIIVNGRHLTVDTRLIVQWDGNKKIFSAKKTPEQWQFINANQIKLHINVGIKSHLWQMVAENNEGRQSDILSFNVVKPFLSKMVIKQILPIPFIGSNQRQTVSIMGRGFSRKTVIKLQWDNNSKRFSTQLTRKQFKFINTNEIQLSIITGIKEREWQVSAINPDGSSSRASFNVVKKSTQSVQNSVSPVLGVAEKKLVIADHNQIKIINDEVWLRAQNPADYTVQLIALSSKQGVKNYIKQYIPLSEQQHLVFFKTHRQNKVLYILLYGHYENRQLARQVSQELTTKIKGSAPWVRRFLTIHGMMESQ